MASLSVSAVSSRIHPITHSGVRDSAARQKAALSSFSSCCAGQQRFLAKGLTARRRQAVPVVQNASSSTLKFPDQEKNTSRDHLTVGDCMTKGTIYVVKVNTTVDEALEKLVKYRISGMPVVDDDGKVVGVVSDYDLLALDSISGKKKSSEGIFPEAGSSWKAFKEIQILLLKNTGSVVGDVMTPNPLCCRSITNIEDAVRVLIQSKFHRLPVVDENGKLIGLLTRGNVVRAALMMKRAAEGKGMGPKGGN
eukprot:TRINITY_DN22638_c0_g1_i1.p1 TRINITY_DN22638_c0_g1~~TRINITY_DN22638_c0_g1_i1.p1  ORF type:complete len:251 (+),score=29.90 TRINITY_DN22638_c0_g1_i1:170-922(+)